jgi:hypothetical protein
MNQTLINELDALRADLVADETADDLKVEGYKKEIVSDYIRKSATLFESFPPTSDITINIDCNHLLVLAEVSYLQRLHAAYSNNAKTITIICNDSTV